MRTLVNLTLLAPCQVNLSVRFVGMLKQIICHLHDFPSILSASE